ncbi:HAD hydrolase-like protein, partial [Candidatus Peregrinibacteria bacterium]|nr:HAD hydrolase-like protein [Candidatus Peregrinibacteria bacterium]
DEGKLFEGAFEILADLKNFGHRLFLIGKGTKERENFIYELKIDQFFEKIILKEEKDIQDFESIKRVASSDEEIFSVGDRIKKEILLSNRCGFKTIWFKNGKFAEETPDQEDENPWKTIYALNELKSLFLS